MEFCHDNSIGSWIWWIGGSEYNFNFHFDISLLQSTQLYIHITEGRVFYNGLCKIGRTSILHSLHQHYSVHWLIIHISQCYSVQSSTFTFQTTHSTYWTDSMSSRVVALDHSAMLPPKCKMLYFCLVGNFFISYKRKVICFLRNYVYIFRRLLTY